MIPEIVFVGEEDSEFIKHTKNYFDKINKISFFTKNLIKMSNEKNVCYVTNLSGLGMMNSDSDMTLSVLFVELKMNIRKKLININTDVYKMRAPTEIINNNPYVPVGTAFIVPISSDNNSYAVCAPTQTYRNNVINTSKNFYYFFKAVLKLVRNYNLMFHSKKIDKIVVPNITQNEEDVKNMFSAYFDIVMGLDTDKTSFNTPTIYYFRAPTIMNYSQLNKKNKTNNKKIQ